VRADRVIAAATAVVVAGGLGIVASGVTTGGGGHRRPAQIASADRPAAMVTTTPTPTGTSATASPTPRRTHRAAAPAAPLYPLPAPPAYPYPCPPPPIPPGPPPPPPPKPTVPDSALPAPLPIAPNRHVNLVAVSGKGMWLTTWADTKVDVPQVVAQAKAAGLRQLWVRTGGSRQGWYGARLLAALLPAAHSAGIAVVAWDFPTLSDPVADARRAAKAIDGTFAGQHIDAFSPDIETINEGTFDTARRVAVYLSYVRRDAGAMPVVATVMRPTAYQLRTYPYRAEAPYVDVFAPMVYWSCDEPGADALASLQPLIGLRPVHLIGQSYDMASEGGRHGLPTGREIWRFLDVARRAGAIGASLYVYSETRAPQWNALGRYPWP
jgi:hypothetical protein